MGSEEQFSKLFDEIAKISTETNHINNILGQIEAKQCRQDKLLSEVRSPRAAEQAWPSTSGGAQAQQQPVEQSGTETVGDNSVDCQQEFAVIRDALQRVKLPNDMKVDDSRQGVQRKDQSRLNLIVKNARFAETSLKLLSTIVNKNVANDTDYICSAGDLQDLTTIVTAQIKYLQEEHSMLLVNNNFGENVEKIYRHFRRNTSTFDSTAIGALQAAVTLNNSQVRDQRNDTFRGRGRFPYRNNRRRGGYSYGGGGYNVGQLQPRIGDNRNSGNDGQ